MKQVAEPSPVSKDRAVRGAAYLAFLCAFLSAGLGDPWAVGQIAIFGAAALWSLLLEGRFRRLFLPPTLKILLVAGGAAFFLFVVARRLPTLPEGIAVLLSRFLFWNAIVFLLSRHKTEYDLWTLGIIDLSLFMLAGAFVPSPRFLPLLALAVLATLYVFLRLAWIRTGTAGRGGGILALSQFVLVLGLGMGVFLVFPRSALRFPVARKTSPPADPKSPPANLPERKPVPTGDPAKTGLPKRLDSLPLASYSGLLTDPTPVLRLEVLRSEVPPSELRYLRGAILDRYERGQWSAEFLRQPAREIRNEWTMLPTAEGSEVEQKIQLQPVAGDLLFAMAEPVRVRLSGIRYDPAGILFLSWIPQEMLEYEVTSRLVAPVEGGSLSTDGRYLQVPRGLDAIHRIAIAQTRGRTTAREKADSLLRYLAQSDFRYELAPFVPSEGMDAVEYFLTRKRSGYCVHYAAAFALLCRAAGVPSRVVTGFQLRNFDGKQFLVRNSDAHAWVEVFGGSMGWIAYDPTPAATSREGEPVATEAKAVPPAPEPAPQPEAKRWDSFWVDFGADDQGSLLHLVSRGFAALARPAVGLSFLAILGAAVLGYLLLSDRHKRRIRQRLAGFREGCDVDFYRDFLWILARRGLRKSRGQTGWEFAAAARARFDDPGIDRVTQRFYEVRYGGRTLGLGEREEVDRVLRRLHRSER